MAEKTGSVAATLAAKHLCHILNVWRPKIDQFIADAVSDGTIDSAAAAALKTWLDAAAGACDILRVITGY